jgi:hypothetical protein
MTSDIQSLPRKLRRLSDRLIYRFSSYRPQLLDRIDFARLQAEAGDYFHLSPEELSTSFQRYRRFHEERGYEQSLGESRTLSFEEAFLVFLSLQRIRPEKIVEIGTQYGKSTRRILDMRPLLDLEARVTCFDILDELRFVTRDEINLVIRDISGEFRAVLEKEGPAFIFLDARPYPLLKEVVSEFLAWSLERPAILAIHDCSPGLYNPKMRLPKDQPERISSRSGVWERHVLAEVLSMPESSLADARTATHHLRVFSTRHGLALLAPHRVLDPKNR